MKIHGHQVVIALLAGFLLGALFMQWQDGGFCRWKKGGMKQHMVGKLSRELSLSAEQKTKLEAIFDAKKPRMTALREEMRPKFEALRAETNQEIRLILNPEQQQKFDEVSRKMEERWKKRREEFEIRHA